MQPQIALLFCILFILFLFISDHQHDVNASRALWIPTIWILIAGSKLPSQWINSQYIGSVASAYLEGNPIDRTVFSILITASLIILIKRKINWAWILQNNKSIFLLFIYFALSILWSDFPGTALRKYVKGIGNLLMVLVILTDDNPIDAIKIMIKRCTYLLIPLSVLFIKYYPDIGRAYGWWSGEAYNIGVTTSKNMLGNLSLVCGFYFIINLYTMWHKKQASVDKKKFIKDILIFCMISWVLIVKADSATSLTCFVFGVCVFFAIGFSIVKKHIKYFGSYVFVAVIVLSILQLSFDIKNIFISKTERETTFYGRTELWKDAIAENPNLLLGTGYESFWLGDRLKKIWSKHPFEPNQAHNGYVEFYINYGIVGLSLLIEIIIITYTRIKKQLLYNFEYARFQMALFFMILLYNITEAAFRGISLIWIIFIIVALNVPRIPTIGSIEKRIFL